MADGPRRPVPPHPTTPDLYPTTQATLPDVPTDFWSYKHIEYIADPARAVTGGYNDGLYHPEIGCSRDQMAAFIQRAFGL